MADRACSRIERAILSGTFARGMALGEAELAGQLGISRGPVREAMNRPEGRGLLQRVPQVGMRVVCLSDIEISEISEMREVLEGLAARLAAERMDPCEIDGLEAAAPFRHIAPTLEQNQLSAASNDCT